ncbi:MAG: alpha/beta hydrolase [Luteibaculaceae bacterium]
MIEKSIKSTFLNREVNVTIVGLAEKKLKAPILLLNDGQDLTQLGAIKTIEHLLSKNKIEPFILVAVHSSDKRLLEYGVIDYPDYKNRGNQAKNYFNFMKTELFAFLIKQKIAIYHPRNTIAGFSLGGLSAFDLAYNTDLPFYQIGVFSGSFWWRSKVFNPSNKNDNKRIIHKLIKQNPKPIKPLKFWLQAGTHDELDDRNNNGIIDAIDDTLDVVHELSKKGFRPYDEVKYIETAKGEHNFKTWKKEFPKFLIWAFGRDLNQDIR